MPFFAHSKIKPLRQIKGLTQSDMASELGISRPTYILIEQGEREPTLSHLYTLARLLGVEIDELGTNLPHPTATSVDYPKFRELVAACVSLGTTSGTITKTKLSILTYLVDFSFFRSSERLMTGQTYRQTSRGPVADDFFRAIDDLFESQRIAIEPQGTSLIITSIEQITPKLLSRDELAFAQKVCAKWRAESTEAILNFAHQQTGSKNKPGEPIPYESVLHIPEDLVF